MFQILQVGIDNLTGSAGYALKDLGVVRDAAKYRKRDGWLPLNRDSVVYLVQNRVLVR